jgi:hypothetical protein
MRIYLDVETCQLFCRGCRKVKQQKLDSLADHPSYTKHFAIYVDHRCWDSTVRDVAKWLHLDWIDLQGLGEIVQREQTRRSDRGVPKVLDIHVIALRQG